MSSAGAAASAGAGSAGRPGATADRDCVACGRDGGVEVGEVGAEGVVELAGDVALEADDFRFGQAFGGAACGVGAGALAVAEPADDDQVECTVGVAVAAAVEPVSARASGGGGDRAGAAEAREGAVVGESLDVLASGGEELG